jgi:hypothetical protein
MKDILLLTSSSKEYWPLTEMTWPIHEKYAKKHNIFCHKRRIDQPTRVDRILLWTELLSMRDPGGYLFAIGADAFITNLSIRPEKFTAGGEDLIIAADNNGYLNADVLFMRHGPPVFKMLEWLLENHDREIDEQRLLQMYLTNSDTSEELWKKVAQVRKWGIKEPWTAKMRVRLNEIFNQSTMTVKVLPPRDLNAYPLAEYQPDVHFQVNELDAWQPGDFVIHFPGLSLEKRLEVFPKYMAFK